MQDQIKILIDQMEVNTENRKVTCKEDTELWNLIYSFHDNSLPNDWIFDSTLSLLERLSEYEAESPENFRDVAHEIVDGSIDIYNHDLIEWSKTFYHLIDEARDEGLINRETDFIKQIQCGQFMLLDRMCHQLIDLINTMAVDS